VSAREPIDQPGYNIHIFDVSPISGGGRFTPFFPSSPPFSRRHGDSPGIIRIIPPLYRGGGGERERDKQFKMGFQCEKVPVVLIVAVIPRPRNERYIVSNIQCIVCSSHGSVTNNDWVSVSVRSRPAISRTQILNDFPSRFESFRTYFFNALF
jgi:hypothetical protein